MNLGWRTTPPERVDIRLKRVYEVHLRDAGGQNEIRYVLAKSVGGGWLGYHAFQTGQAIAEFVPPLLGLRDGILYTEWLPQQRNALAAFPARTALGATRTSCSSAPTNT